LEARGHGTAGQPLTNALSPPPQWCARIGERAATGGHCATEGGDERAGANFPRWTAPRRTARPGTRTLSMTCRLWREPQVPNN
jgi:hypothetical protein